MDMERYFRLVFAPFVALVSLGISPSILAYELAGHRLADPSFVGSHHIVLSVASRNGLYLLNTVDGSLLTLSEERGSGRYVHASERGLIAYKEISDSGRSMKQRACFYDVMLGDAPFTSSWYPLCGNPSFSSNGAKAFSTDDCIIILGNSKDYRIPVDHYANCTPLSPDGSALVYNDEQDQLWLYQLATNGRVKITDGHAGYMLPSWSPDNEKLLFSSLGGELFVYLIDHDSLLSLGVGFHPRWIDENRIVFVVHTVDRYELVASDIAIHDLGSATTSIVFTPMELETEPCINGNRILYVSLIDGALYEARIDAPLMTNVRLLLERSAVPSSGSPKRRDERANIILNIPYLHQLYDTKDAFNGSWACGPTSCDMAVQSYNMLPNWSTICSWPFAHMSLFGRYISDIYTYNGITYDWMSLDPNNNPAYGAYGYICPYGGAVWANMEQYNTWHQLSSYMDVTPTWEEFFPEIDDGYPVVVSTQLTTAGHIVLGKGYVENQHTMITNDPYGDKNLVYTNYYGSGAFYDWPGYNNGYENLNQVKVYIGARYDFPPTVVIFDDLDTVFSYLGNWLERSGGYDMHAYYTETAVQGDTAFWKIPLSEPDSISVFTEFYRGVDRVRNGSYFVVHENGTAVTTVDQRGYGLSGWYELGTFFFTDTVVVGATDTGSDSAGVVLADAVMLVFHQATGISNPSRASSEAIRAFPNPSSGCVTILLPGSPEHGKPAQQELTIYDSAGRRVRRILLPTPYSLLPTQITWDRRDSAGKMVPRGVYFIKVTRGETTFSTKVTLL